MPSPRSLRLALVVVLVALLGCAGVTLTPVPAHAQNAEVEVVLTAISPVLQKDGTLEAAGTVTNTGDVALQTVNAAMWISLSPLQSRESLAAAAAESPGDRLGARITEPAELLDEMTDSLAPGASAAFTLKVPVDELGLSGAGVYPVGVDVRANAPNELRDTVGRARTFAAYLPDPSTVGRVNVAYVVPFTAAPTSLADGSLVSDSLAADLAPEGRLGKLLTLATAPTNVLTPAIDPNLLAEAATLAGEHTVRTPTVRKAGADPNAEAFVVGLKALTATKKPLVLPFADTDVVSLAHRGLTEPLGGLGAVTTAAATAADPALTGPVTAMPADGYADAASLETLAASGVRRGVLSSATLPDLSAGTPAVTIPTSEGTVSAVVTDPALLAPTETSALMSRQRFLAETALMALGTPKGTTYRTVAALPRNLQPTDATRELLSPSAVASWLKVGTLDQVTAGKAPSYTGTLRYPQSVRDTELDATLTGATRAMLNRSAVLVDIVGDRENASATWRRAALRGSSIAWRTNPAEGIRFVSANSALIDSQLSQVRLSVPQFVTLTGSSGSFPVTISNQLSVPVTVFVRITSPDHDIVAPSEVQKIEIDGKRRVTSRFIANSNRDGVVRLTAELVTSDGKPLGSQTAFTIRVTQYGMVGWVILGAGVALLLVAGVYRQIRAHRRSKLAVDESDGAADAPGSAAAPGDVPGSTEETERTS